jgi:hypothetical protein
MSMPKQKITPSKNEIVDAASGVLGMLPCMGWSSGRVSNGWGGRTDLWLSTTGLADIIDAAKWTTMAFLKQKTSAIFGLVIFQGYCLFWWSLDIDFLAFSPSGGTNLPW